MRESLQDQLQRLSHMLMDAQLLADDIKKRISEYPDASSTERSETQIIPRDLAACYGRVQYLSVAFRRID